MIDLYTASILVFIAILAMIVYKERHKVERQSILILRRTTRGKKFIVRLGTSHPRFWKWVGNIAVLVTFAFSFWDFWLIGELTTNLIMNPSAATGFSFVLPVPTTTAIIAPGFFGVPFWPWVISLAVLIVFHEGFHGIFAAREKIKIKALGVGLLAVIPLAFVEPDEKQLKKKPDMPQLRVYAAGSFANFLVAGVSLLLALGLALTFFTPAGVPILGQEEGLPAQELNITGTIISINGEQTLSMETLDQAFAKTRPGQEITVTTELPSGETKTFTTITVENPKNSSRGYIGISIAGHKKEPKAEFMAYGGGLLFLEDLLYYLFIINFGVGAFNLLPVRGLDGGSMWKIIFRRITKKHHEKLINITTWIIIFALVVNFGAAFSSALAGIL